ncbi:hypothetical protein GCM10007386_32410 [Pseudoduganella dura]|nr:hypothetical protein GCM10007386_32410 [Pseudoduganella dura]
MTFTWLANTFIWSPPGFLMIVVLNALPNDPAPAAPQPAPAPGAGFGYAPYVYIDSETGCEYLSTHTSTGLVPRMAADGLTHKGCKEATR